MQPLVFEIPRYCFLRMHSLVRQRFLDRFIFIHINKCGGTSIERALHVPLLNHDTALERLRIVGKKRWNACYKFSFVRNPFDKVVSHYDYRRLTNQTSLGDEPIPFGEWVRRAYRDGDPGLRDNEKMFMPQLAWISDRSGKVMMDYVGRFETIEQDFQNVCSHLGIRATLPHLKASRDRNARGLSYYRRCYSDESREIIEKHFAGDLEAFGYEF